MGKHLINFVTCGCGSSAPFFVIYKAGREPMPYWSVLTLEGNSGEKVALWLLTSLCTSVKSHQTPNKGNETILTLFSRVRIRNTVFILVTVSITSLVHPFL
jgi:hypothetical protein